jgi:hypothetical protein
MPPIADPPAPGGSLPPWVGKCDSLCRTRMHCFHHQRCLAECMPEDLAPPAPSAPEALAELLTWGLQLAELNGQGDVVIAKEIVKAALQSSPPRSETPETPQPPPVHAVAPAQAMAWRDGFVAGQRSSSQAQE